MRTNLWYNEKIRQNAEQMGGRALYKELRTERLVLRPLGTEDQDSTHQYASDGEHTRYMIFLPNKTPEDTQRFLARVEAEWEKPAPAFYEFAITADDRHIGAVSLSLSDDGQEGEMGWILSREAIGKGYAAEAAAALRDFAWDELKVKKLTAYCDSRNTPSRRLMEKLGMRLLFDDGKRQYPDDRGEASECGYVLSAI
jgi:ribosomal-protein-alanine N-acetyltransferase